MKYGKPKIQNTVPYRYRYSILKSAYGSARVYVRWRCTYV